MQAVKGNRTQATSLSNKSIYIAMILIIATAVGLYAYNVFNAFQPGSLPQGTVVIGPADLEAKYGLHVSLIAVTASGGLVDVRLRIVDGEKAKSFLQDPANFPALFINGILLNVSEDTKAQEINFKDDGNIFLLYANPHNTVRTGASVNVVFGKTALEPISVK